MQIQSFWTINSAYLNGACVTKMAEHALPAPLALDGCFSLRITFLSLSESHQGRQVVVISRKKAADTGSLLTLFV